MSESGRRMMIGVELFGRVFWTARIGHDFVDWSRGRDWRCGRKVQEGVC